MSMRDAFNRANVWCIGLIFSVQPFLVEVAYFCFFLSRHMTLPIFQQYVRAEIFKQHGLNVSTVQLQNSDLNGSTSSAKYVEAQRESTYTVLSLQLAEGLPAVVTVVILGAVSDRTGRRKILLWIPALGGLVYSLIYVLIMYTGWTLDGLFLASAIRGLSGSMTAFLAGGTYFAINSVAKEKRSSRLAIQEFLNGISYALANIMVGYWVKASGFTQPLWFTVIFASITFLVAFFLVKDIKNEPENSINNRYTSENCCIDTFKPMGKFFKCHKDKKLIKIWLAVLAFQTYSIVHIGQIDTLVLYLSGKPMLWESHRIGTFLSVLMGVAALGTLVTPPVLRNWFSDIHITFGGLFSKAVGTMWIAVIHNETVLYFAIFLLVLELIPFPMLRSIVANGFETADQGTLFALMHCGESVSYFLAPFMFQSIYAGTLHYYSGFVFVISVILLVFPVAFTIAIKFLDMNQPDRVEYEPMDGETEMCGTDDPVERPADVGERQAISIIPVGEPRPAAV
ncbi:hypothetical protein FSP39_006733 [Pinctada imbricata]|uniref:Uncharacterized protein n=1 Tax=Pinctada imbricata TaxID=66713 RepID=A0AA88XYQ3_PINIB|nr:hypothetical protein FSP39_006733 [Pinctada imbricata]